MTTLMHYVTQGSLIGLFLVLIFVNDYPVALEALTLLFSVMSKWQIPGHRDLLLLRRRNGACRSALRGATTSLLEEKCHQACLSSLTDLTYSSVGRLLHLRDGCSMGASLPLYEEGRISYSLKSLSVLRGNT